MTTEPTWSGSAGPTAVSPAGRVAPGTARVEAFSDGVLAVAITLLVLDLKVPHVEPGSVWPALLDQWPGYAAYVTSFLSIGIMWMNHHSLFVMIARADRKLLFVNLLLLLLIVTVPFSTSLVAEYLTHPGFNGKIAMAIYSGQSFLMGLGFAALWGYPLTHPRLLADGVDVAAARRAFPRFAIGSAVYGALVAVSFLNPAVALALHVSVAVYYAFERLPVGQRAGSHLG